MKNTYIKAGVVLLCSFTLSTIIAPTLTTLAAESNHVKTTNLKSINDKQDFIDIGDDSLKEISYNKFIIEENGLVFEQEFFVESNIIEINEVYYDLDQYILALNNENASVSEALNNILPLELSSPPKQLNITTFRATLPKTGYKPLQFAGSRKKISMVHAVSVGAVAALTAFLFPGAGVAITTAYVKNVLAKGIAAGVLSVGTQSFTATAYYDIYQAFHKTTIGAVKEQRKPYSEIQNRKFYGNTYEFYFWATRPQ